MAVRDNPEKATYLGIDVKRYRWYAFIISGVYAAVGGVLLGPCHRAGGSNPDLLDPIRNPCLYDPSWRVCNFFGPLLGALIYIFLQDTVMSLLHYWRFVFGALLAFIVILAPGGVAGIIGSLLKKEGRRNRGEKMVILSASDLRKYYGGFCALDGVSFQINEGEFVSIIGPNGAGKTTLINVLTGLLKPNTGKGFFKE